MCVSLHTAVSGMPARGPDAVGGGRGEDKRSLLTAQEEGMPALLPEQAIRVELTFTPDRLNFS